MRAFAFGILFLLVSAAMLALVALLNLVGGACDLLRRAATYCVSRT